MRYGFYLPTRGPTATRDGVLALAREGERLGLHSAMIADHIVFPVESESAYPYTLDRKHPSGGDALETFSILGVVAARRSGCASSPPCWCCPIATRCSRRRWWRRSMCCPADG